MGDPSLRKSSALKRLRSQLKKKQESLADHFDFKMYVTFHFKEKVYIQCGDTKLLFTVIYEYEISCYLWDGKVL
jgi:hypothetical protein